MRRAAGSEDFTVNRRILLRKQVIHLSHVYAVLCALEPRINEAGQVEKNRRVIGPRMDQELMEEQLLLLFIKSSGRESLASQ